MPRKPHDTPRVIEALDNAGLEIDLLARELEDLDRALSAEQRSGALHFARDIQQQCHELRASWPAYAPPPPPPYSGKRRPRDCAIRSRDA
jgi:hypothetical protein